ncbi:MAG: tandem-95 repeat protein, partial [Kordiimonadaceae bacterium]|nr:tandem-95 repeat protein [Kordiimonadaceae bacterium]
TQVLQDQPYAFQALAVDQDAGSRLTYSIDNKPDWATFDVKTGLLSGLANNDNVGTYQTIKVTVSDGQLEASLPVFSLEVQNVNDAPTGFQSLGQQSVNEDALLTLTTAGVFKDIDEDIAVGETRLYSTPETGFGVRPDWLSLDTSTGVLTGTPDNDDVGSYVIELMLTDKAGASAFDLFTVEVINVNDAPELVSSLGTQSAREDDELILDLSKAFRDVDAGDNLTYSVQLSGGSALPTWLTLDAETGILTGTPENEDVKDLALKVTVQDSAGETAVDNVVLTVENVNDAPQLKPFQSLANQSIDEDDGFSLNTSLVFQDVDPGDTLKYSATLFGGSPLPTWLNINPTNGMLSGTPLNDDVGVINVTVTVTDAAGESAQDDFFIRVKNTNDAPEVNAGLLTSQTVAEDSTQWSFNASTAFSDVDFRTHPVTGAQNDPGEKLTYSAKIVNGNGSKTALTQSWLKLDTEGGIFSGIPLNDDVGSLAVEVTATDSHGAKKAGTFAITVTNTNDEPTVENVFFTAQSLDEDSSTWAYPVASAFSDVDVGDTRQYSLSYDGARKSNWLTINSDGVLSGTPLNDDVGVHQITVTMTDSADASVTSRAFSLTVINTNDQPQIAQVIPAQEALEESLYQLDTTTGFKDIDIGDQLTYQAELANGQALPTWLSFNTSTGLLSGTPANSDIGLFSEAKQIKVTATDIVGEEISQKFNLEVKDRPDPPFVINQPVNQTIDEDSTLGYGV